jgi:hypothetical protein
MTRTLALAFVCVLAAARTAPAQPASSSLQGRVVRWGSPDPIAKAIVELRRDGPGNPPPYVTTTTTDGLFTFSAVVPGPYRIVVTRPGFVSAEYGQRWPSGAGTPLTIPAGQAVSNVPIAMLATGAISGTVRDQFGKPLGSAEVVAFKAIYPTGRRELSKVQSVWTDDRGEYRLFWMTPGRYFIAARHPDLGSGLMRMGGIRIGGGGVIGSNGPIGFQQFRASGDNASAVSVPGTGPRPPASFEAQKFVEVYYPNTTDETVAVPLEVTEGGELRAIDLSVAPLQQHRVRGRVVYESNNEPAMSARVQWLTPSGAAPVADVGAFGIVPMLTQVQCCDGAFELALPSGAYTLVAAVNSLSARASVTVGDDDVDGVVLAIGRGFDVKGRLIVEGRTPTAAELQAFRVALALDPPVAGLVPDAYSNILPNGAFTLHAGRGSFRIGVAPFLVVPGAFMFPAMNAPASLTDVYVKSIRLGDVDVLNSPLQLDGPAQEPLEIVIGTATGTLEGLAVGQNRQPLANVTIALVSDRARRSRVDLMKSTSSDASGHFRFAGLAPGDYVVVAIDGPDDGEWRNPDFVAAREGQGVAVRVTAGRASSAELTALPPQ